MGGVWRKGEKREEAVVHRDPDEQVWSLPCFPPLFREIKQFSPIPKWSISTFVEALLTLSYSGPRVFPGEAGPSPKEEPAFPGEVQ